MNYIGSIDDKRLFMSQHIHIELVIPAEMAGLRFDQALAQLLPDYSRARLQTWLRDEQITINGKHPRQRDRVKGEEQVVLHATLATETCNKAQDVGIDIVYEDDDLLVINKAVGLVVHPAAGNHDGTLLNALLYHCAALEHLPRAGIVHRLDKDTSGLLVVAKNLVAHHSLVQQLQARSIHREYVALVHGVMTAGGTISAAIGRHPRQRKLMAVVPGGKAAVSHYRVLQRYAEHTLVKVMLETGRTHQIRVHMAHIGYPIVGDQQYAGRFRVPKGASEQLREILSGFKTAGFTCKKAGADASTNGASGRVGSRVSARFTSIA